MRRTALELLQTLRAKGGKSIFVTSAAQGEGKTEVAVSMAGELASLGKSVLILETDPENTELAGQIGLSGEQPGCMLSDLLQGRADLESIAADIPDQGFRVVFANRKHTQDDSLCTAEDIERILEQAEKLADVVLVDGCIWTESGEGRIWKETADTALAVCRQDKADFYAIDRMMTDLRENSSFLGCVLYGF